MLANTADTGTLEYNTADGTLWFLHAVGRHVERTGDLDLAAELAAGLVEVVEAHVAGTRFGIGVDPADGLLTQGRRRPRADLDGRPRRRRARHAARRQGGRDQRALDQRPGDRRRPARAAGARCVGRARARGQARAAVPRRVLARRSLRRRGRRSAAAAEPAPRGLASVRAAPRALGRRGLCAARHLARPAQPRPGRPGLRRPPPRRNRPSATPPTTRARSGRG